MSGSVGSASSDAALAAVAADQARSSSSRQSFKQRTGGTLRLESLAPFATEEPGGCSFSPSGELLIGGLGIDGRNAWTGEAGWAAPTRANTWQGRRLIPAPMSPTLPRRGSQLLPTCPVPAAVAPSACSRAGSSFVACSPANSSAGSCKPGSARQTLKDAWRIVARRPSSVTELGDPLPIPRAPVNVEDVVEGRTCRPISLPDFRKHLLAQRITNLEPSPSMRSNIAELPDLSLLGGTIVAPKQLDLEAGHTEKTFVSPPTKRSKAENGSGDQLDALDFVVAVDRYSREFRSQNATQRARTPDVAVVVAMATTGSPQVVPSSADAAADVKTAAPADQPLRRRFDHIVATYLGTLDQHDDERTQPRLRWMSNTGLLSDSLLQETHKTAARTTHPDALTPITLAAMAHLDAYVLPDFLDEASQNLSSKTKLGRLFVGVVCTSIAIALSVLLIMDPSPLSPRYRAARAGADVDASIVRWWRLLTFPLWSAGTGYVLAAYTGVCVWLSLRGHREPERAAGVDSAAEVEAARPAHLKRRPGSSGTDHEKGALEGTTDDEEQHVSAKHEPGAWLMAPELKHLLLRLAGRSRSEPTFELPTAMPSLDAMPVPPPTLAHTPSTSPLLSRGSKLLASRNISTSTATSSVLTRSFSVPGLPLSMGFVSARPPIEEESSKLAPRASITTLHAASTAAASVNTSARKSPFKRTWEALQRWTGFAVGTEQVMDERVRGIHQRAAIMALVQCMVLTLICTIVVMVIP